MADDDDNEEPESQLRIGGLIPVLTILVVLIVMYIRHKYLAWRYPHKYPRPPPPPTPPPPPPRPPLPPIPEYERNNPFVYNDREWGASPSSLNQTIDIAINDLNATNNQNDRFQPQSGNANDGSRISIIDTPPPDFSSIDHINRQREYTNQMKTIDADSDLPKYEDLNFAADSAGGRRENP